MSIQIAKKKSKGVAQVEAAASSMKTLGFS